MASCKLGHIYIVETVLTKPPKAKFAVCVCIDPGYFLWVNSNPRPHGRDQVPLPAGCHELVTKNCFLDLSRVVQHPTFELEDAKEFARIDQKFAGLIVAAIDAGLFLLPPSQGLLIRNNFDGWA